MYALNHKLKFWRKALDLTQEQAADRLEVTQQAYSRYESGRVPKKPVMDRIIERTKNDPVPLTPNDFYGVEFDVVGEGDGQAA